MDKRETSILQVISILLAIPLMFWWAFVAVELWRWFLIPIFGVQAISYAQALGLSCILGMFMTIGPIMRKEYLVSEGERILATLFLGLFGPAHLLLFGYLIHLFC